MIRETYVYDLLRHNVMTYRKEQKLSQPALAIKSGLPLKTIQKIEGYEYDEGISLTTLIKIANSFNITLCELLDC